jgi:hypothetical protein
VVGTSTRTYSGSGGACSLAFFTALLYEGRSVGEALRQAKNFLLLYALLKEKRLGPGARRTGANLRAAWAFTLWGDPTLRLPRPTTPDAALPRVKHRREGGDLVLTVPEQSHERVASGKYRAKVPANARLAGLIRREEGGGASPLVPFVFAEVSLPAPRAGQAPRLRSKLPAGNWVSLWDGRRQVVYLLAIPRPRDGRELRFRVSWPSGPEVASGG